MGKMVSIDVCYECPYLQLLFVGSEGSCNHSEKLGADAFIEDVYEEIPDWCPLEDTEEVGDAKG